VKIILIRHTEVDEAYHKCYNGHINIGLSLRGEKQAQLLAEEFKNHIFDLVYCSDLLRTRETLSPTFDAIIAEGEIEYENFLQWIRALDGEDYELYISRIKEFFLEFLIRQKAENILVVTHAGVIRVLISLIKDISLEEVFSFDVSYGAYLILDTKTMSFSEVKYKLG